MKNYKAPWSASLVVISLVASIVLVGTAVALLVRDPHALAGWLLVAVVFLGALFVIRGYAISPNALLVRRLFWSTRLPLADLEAAQVVPDVMDGSWRLFGNGGLFTFSGLYRNETLGRYRAYVTNPHRTVVLRYPARTVVVSPSDPEEFVRELVGSRGTDLRPSAR